MELKEYAAGCIKAAEKAVDENNKVEAIRLFRLFIKVLEHLIYELETKDG